MKKKVNFRFHIYVYEIIIRREKKNVEFFFCPEIKNSIGNDVDDDDDATSDYDKCVCVCVCASLI